MSVLTVYFLSFHDLLDGLHDGLFASLKSKFGSLASVFGSSFDALGIVTSLLIVLGVGFLSMFNGDCASEVATAYLEVIISEGGRLNTIGELSNEVDRQVAGPLELAGGLLEVGCDGLGISKLGYTRGEHPERGLGVPRNRLATHEVRKSTIGAESLVKLIFKMDLGEVALLLAYSQHGNRKLSNTLGEVDHDIGCW